MSQPTTRITLEEFSRDVAGFLEQVARSGQELEVVWGGTTVAIVPQTSDRPARPTPGELIERWRLPQGLRRPLPLTPEQLEERRQAIQRGEELGARLLARRGGAPAPSNLDLIHEEQDERTRQINERR